MDISVRWGWPRDLFHGWYCTICVQDRSKLVIIVRFD
jgi:hypothetical protein